MKAAHPSAIDAEVRELKSAERDSVWIADHYTRLRKTYDREFIAVYRRRVVDHDKDGARLAMRLRRDHPRTEPVITVTYVTSDEVDLIL